MTDLLSLMANYVRRHDLFAPGETVVVGVSGGPDSLCLLHLLERMRSGLSLRLHVAHLNHGLRGAEADADADFVARLAGQNGLPYTIGRANVAALAAASGLSIEEAARQVRYRFLSSVAISAGAGMVAVAHNADDQAETVLMHFLRGSGVAGLRGMLPRTALEGYRLTDAESWTLDGEDWRLDAGGWRADESERGAQDDPVARLTGWSPVPQDPIPTPRSREAPALFLVRPLLETSRAEIEAYCAEYGLAPRFDKSNEDRTFFRNRLRHQLLPLLEGYNPEIRRVLGHTAAAMAGDYEVLSGATDEAWRYILRDAGQDEILFDLAAWRALPLGLQRATVRRAIQSLRRSLRNVNWDHVERAVWLARDGSTGQTATLTAGLALDIGYEVLRIAVEGAGSTARRIPQVREPVVLPDRGVTVLNGGWQVITRRLARAELPADFAHNADPWVAWLDAGNLGPTPVLRPRRPGDRFQPQGLGGHNAKLNEFLINVKVPRASRAGWPILEGQRGIAWICGLRLDERATVSECTQEVCEVRFEQAVGADSGFED